MSTFSPSMIFTDGQIPSGADFNQNWNDITTVINQLDRQNIDTQWAQMAIPVRAEREGYGAGGTSKDYYVDIPFPVRSGTAPITARLMYVSAQFIDASGGPNTVTLQVYAGTVTVGSPLTLTGSTTAQASLGGTSEVNSTVHLRLHISTSNDFVSGDFLQVTVFLATQIMNLTEVQS